MALSRQHEHCTHERGAAHDQYSKCDHCSEGDHPVRDLPLGFLVGDRLGVGVDRRGRWLWQTVFPLCCQSSELGVLRPSFTSVVVHGFCEEPSAGAVDLDPRGAHRDFQDSRDFFVGERVLRSEDQRQPIR